MIKYFNAETNEEVHYGEYLTFHSEKEFRGGYKFEHTTTIPIINTTLPSLIEEGFIIQKEVKENRESKSVQDRKTDSNKCDLALELSALRHIVSTLKKQSELLEQSIKSFQACMNGEQKGTKRN